MATLKRRTRATSKVASLTPARKSSPGKKRPVRPLTDAQLKRVVQHIAEPAGTARFAGGKALIVTAEKFPDRVYPHFEAIASLLQSDSRIMRWTALLTLGPLSGVDSGRKIDAVLESCIEFIHGDNLITAANAIKCLVHIAHHRPDLLGRAIAAILDVEIAEYATPECRNVAIGQALKAFETIGPSALNDPRVAAFIGRQVDNPRAAAAGRARRLHSLGRAKPGS